MDLDLTAVGAALIVVAPIALLILRINVIPDGASLEDLIAPRVDLEWPHGVQEEEPIPWRIEVLTPPDRRVSEPARRQAIGDVSRVPGP
jgi:hypothetical protein